MRKVALLLAAVFFLLQLSGCWDMQEINSRCYILGLGMDSTDVEGDFLFTFQRAVPVGVDSSADSNSVAYENISVTASSPAQAVRALGLSSSMELSFTHLSCVIIGSALAHNSFSPLLEYLTQQSDLRRQCVVTIAADTAQSLLDSTAFGSSSAAGIASLLEELDHSRGHSVIMTLGRVSTAAMIGRSYCLYAVGRSEDILSGEPDSGVQESALTVTGAYIFSSEGFVGTLDAQQSDLLRLFSSGQDDGLISAAHASGKTVYFWIDRSQCSISCDIGDDQLRYFINVSASCSIADAAGVPTSDISTELLEQALSSQLQTLTSLSQEKLGAALLGLDTAARRADSRWYSEHFNEFPEYFRSAVIELEVSCQLERSGVIN